MTDPVKLHTVAVQARIDEICELMRSCQFRTGKTIKELAKKWGMSIPRVKEYSAEASHIVRKELTDPDRVFSILGPALEEAILDATKTRDFRQLAALARTFADITGSSAASRHTVEVKSDLNAMTHEQLVLEAEREIARMKGSDEGPVLTLLPSAESRTVPLFDEIAVAEFVESEDE